jgi:hypothetical protein
MPPPDAAARGYPMKRRPQFSPEELGPFDGLTRAMSEPVASPWDSRTAGESGICGLQVTGQSGPAHGRVRQRGGGRALGRREGGDQVVVTPRSAGRAGQRRSRCPKRRLPISSLGLSPYSSGSLTTGDSSSDSSSSSSIVIVGVGVGISRRHRVARDEAPVDQPCGKVLGGVWGHVVAARVWTLADFPLLLRFPHEG